MVAGLWPTASGVRYIVTPSRHGHLRGGEYCPFLQRRGGIEVGGVP